MTSPSATSWSPRGKRLASRFAQPATVVAALGLALACAPAVRPSPAAAPDGHWQAQRSGTTASLRGISVVSARIAWASGSGGTVLRTVDGGITWRADTVPGATELDFRDVYAVSADTAYLLAAGEGERSRIFKTTNGGRSWTLQYTNRHPQGFFDGMAFWDSSHGIVYGDPVDGRFVLLVTADGGSSWKPVPSERIPPALPGEAGFAASGTGIAVQAGARAWFGTGGARVARVFRTADGGASWTVAETPLRAGEAAGVFSVAFGDGRNGVAVGGAYTEPEAGERSAARTADGGATWTAAGVPPRGYRSGAAFLSDTTGAVVAVGTSGSDLSLDGGTSWAPLGTVGYNAVAFARGGAGWAVGAEGRIAKWLRGGER